jgi:SAM-dependent methyltransferase
MDKDKVKLGQAGKPNGLIGRLFGIIMSKLNYSELQNTIDLLKIGNNDTILEIGFGPGRSFKTISLLTSKVIYGIDHSLEMVNMAERNNKDLIKANRLKLQIGNAVNLEFADNHFDKIFSINCIYFWENPIETIKHIKDKLKTGGLLAITIRNSTHGLNKHYNAGVLTNLFEQNEFKEINVTQNTKHIIAIGKK